MSAQEITRLHLAPALLCTGAMQKKIYKVLAPIQKHNNQGSWFMKVGSGYTNKDDSINLYLDAIPCVPEGGKMTLQIRELDADDLRQRETNRASYARGALGAPGAGFDASSGIGSHGPTVGATGASESIPF